MTIENLEKAQEIHAKIQDLMRVLNPEYRIGGVTLLRPNEKFAFQGHRVDVDEDILEQLKPLLLERLNKYTKELAEL